MHEVARANLAALGRNPYPGRGLVVGLDQTGEYLVQAYWIMGRSTNSRNRVFTPNSGRVFTEIADPSKLLTEEERKLGEAERRALIESKKALIIYNAMDEVPGAFVVSNGDQTDTVVGALRTGESFNEAMLTRTYEPDAPNFTPRITAVSFLNGRHVTEISILRKSPESDECERPPHYRYEGSDRGIGYCITTYSGDGNPLPSFRGEPYPLPLEGDAQAIARTLWAALDADNRVSLAVKFIRLDSGESSEPRIENRFSKVQ